MRMIVNSFNEVEGDKITGAREISCEGFDVIAKIPDDPAVSRSMIDSLSVVE